MASLTCSKTTLSANVQPFVPRSSTDKSNDVMYYTGSPLVTPPPIVYNPSTLSHSQYAQGTIISRGYGNNYALNGPGSSNHTFFQQHGSNFPASTPPPPLYQTSSIPAPGNITRLPTMNLCSLGYMPRPHRPPNMAYPAPHCQTIKTEPVPNFSPGPPIIADVKFQSPYPIALTPQAVRSPGPVLNLSNFDSANFEDSSESKPNINAHNNCLIRIKDIPINSEEYRVNQRAFWKSKSVKQEGQTGQCVQPAPPSSGKLVVSTESASDSKSKNSKRRKRDKKVESAQVGPSKQPPLPNKDTVAETKSVDVKFMAPDSMVTTKTTTDEMKIEQEFSTGCAIVDVKREPNGGVPTTSAWSSQPILQNASINSHQVDNIGCWVSTNVPTRQKQRCTDGCTQTLEETMIAGAGTKLLDVGGTLARYEETTVYGLTVASRGTNVITVKDENNSWNKKSFASAASMEGPALGPTTSTPIKPDTVFALPGFSFSDALKRKEKRVVKPPPIPILPPSSPVPNQNYEAAVLHRQPQVPQTSTAPPSVFQPLKSKSKKKVPKIQESKKEKPKLAAAKKKTRRSDLQFSFADFIDSQYSKNSSSEMEATFNDSQGFTTLPAPLDMANYVEEPVPVVTKSSKPSTRPVKKTVGNRLDSTVPVLHKGKTRAKDLKPKRSLLKKNILLEKRLRKELAMLKSNQASKQDAEQETESTTPEKNEDTKKEDIPEKNSIILDRLALPTDPVTSNIHSRKFREYCENTLSVEVDGHVRLLVQQLGHFQDRIYAKDPNKGRLKKRMLYGFREVLKALKAEKIKMVILAPDIEFIVCPGGLNDIVYNILSLCKSQSIPYIFAMNKSQLGYITHKHTKVSVIGVLNYQGAEEHYTNLMTSLEKVRGEYEAKISQAQNSYSAVNNPCDNLKCATTEDFNET